MLIIGSNTAESHPVLATRVKRSHKMHGQKLIVADLREHEMAQRADVFFRPRPGTDLIWLSAVTKLHPRQRTGRSEIHRAMGQSRRRVQEESGIVHPRIGQRAVRTSYRNAEAVAHMIAEADGVCVLWAMGVTQHSMGSDTSTAISNLLLATGNYMRPGTGAYPLRGHNNVQGASDHGAMPNYFPGYQKVDDPEIRAKFEKAWNVHLPPKPGLDNHHDDRRHPRRQTEGHVCIRRRDEPGRFER